MHTLKSYVCFQFLCTCNLRLHLPFKLSDFFSYSTLASTMYILTANISRIYSCVITIVHFYDDMLQLYWTLMRIASHLLFVYVPTYMSETSSWSLPDSWSQTDTSSLASTGFFCTWVAFRLRCLRTRKIVTTTTIIMMIITITPITITRRGMLVSPAGSLLVCSVES